MKDYYLAQTRLLLDVLPIVSKYRDFALKGGTALNYFLHDMPRLSVDIDLQYLRQNTFDEAKDDIENQVNLIAKEIESTNIDTKCTYISSKTQLLIRNRVDIKIDINPVNRCCIFKPVMRSLSRSVAERFGLEFEMQCLDPDEIYGGKICAALSRQHPRDLFDVHILLKEYGAINRNIILALLICLISTKKPIIEHLSPNKLEISKVYKQKFEGMANIELIVDDLKRVQDVLPGIVLNSLTEADKQFLLGFWLGKPDWDLLPIKDVKDLPAVKRKIEKMAEMKDEKRQEIIDNLEALLI